MPLGQEEKAELRQLIKDEIAAVKPPTHEKHVECPICGDLIVKARGKCNTCQLIYDPAKNAWNPIEKPKGKEDEKCDSTDGLLLL
jgi:hypothetical protein